MRSMFCSILYQRQDRVPCHVKLYVDVRYFTYRFGWHWTSSDTLARYARRFAITSKSNSSGYRAAECQGNQTPGTSPRATDSSSSSSQVMCVQNGRVERNVEISVKKLNGQDIWRRNEKPAKSINPNFFLFLLWWRIEGIFFQFYILILHIYIHVHIYIYIWFCVTDCGLHIHAIEMSLWKS